MHTIEAILSLMFFVAILIMATGLAGQPEQQSYNQFYQLQLAQDSWRVLYLKGDLQEFSAESRVKIESDMAAMGGLTGFCFFIDGIEYTNCRPDYQSHRITASLQKTVIQNQTGQPIAVTFSIAPR